MIEIIKISGGHDMSILRLNSVEHGKIDSRFIQAFDLELCNLGSEGFEMLITVYTHRRAYCIAGYIT